MSLGLEIYELVVSILGVLPIELHFVYGICTILLFLIVIAFVAMPFVMVYKLFS